MTHVRMTSEVFLKKAKEYLDKYVTKSTENYLAFPTRSMKYSVSLLKTHLFELDDKLTNGELTERLYAILEKKNADYSPADDAFYNFENSAIEVGMTVEDTTKVRIMDKISRFKNLMKKSGKAEVVDESLTDTIMDTINYMIITAIYIDATPVSEEDPMDNPRQLNEEETNKALQKMNELIWTN